LSRSEKHWDGSEWVELPEIRVVDAHEYQPRLLPAVVTDTVMGNIRTLSFNHVIHVWTDDYGLYGPRNATYQVFGGRGDFDVTFFCGANDRELQQKLVDVTTMYLTIGRGYLWLYRFVLVGDVRIQGDGVEGEVQQERVWYGNLLTPVSADWRLIVPRDQVERFDIDIDLVTPDDPFESPDGLAPGVLTPMDPEGARARLVEMQRQESAQAPASSLRDLMIEGSDAEDLPLRPMRSYKKVQKE